MAIDTAVSMNSNVIQLNALAGEMAAVMSASSHSSYQQIDTSIGGVLIIFHHLLPPFKQPQFHEKLFADISYHEEVTPSKKIHVDGDQRHTTQSRGFPNV